MGHARGPNGAVSCALLLAVLPGTVLAQGDAWVAFLHTPPDAVHPDADLVLAGSVIGARPGDEVVVRYRREGERTYRSTPVLPAFGDTYEAVIPAEHVGPPSMEYYVEWVAGGARRTIHASSVEPERVSVVVPQTARRRPEVEVPAPAEPSEAPPAPADDDEGPLASLPTLTPTPAERAPAIVTVIDRARIQSIGARTLVDVLKTLPGLETSRDVQGFHRLGVRGIRSDPEILLLYDGHRLSNLYDGRNLYELPLENVARIEVIRGPAAAVHGTGAFLAVIDVIPLDRDGVVAASVVDTFGVVSAHAAGGLPLGPGALRLDADVETGRGYRETVLTDTFGGTRARPAGITDDRRLFLQAGARGRHPLAGSELGWSLRTIYQRRGALLGAFDAVGAGSNLEWLVFLGEGSFSRSLGSGSLLLRAFGDLQVASRAFKLTPTPHELAGGEVFDDGVVEAIQHATQRVGADARVVLDLPEHNRLTAGVELALHRLAGFDYQVNFEPGSGRPLDALTTPAGATVRAEAPGLSSRLAVAGFVQDVWTLAEVLDVTGGVRADFFSGGVGRENPAAPPEERGSLFRLSPRVAAVLAPTAGLSFKALYATAFRTPTFEELTSVVVPSDFTRGRFQGNPTLGPVTIRTAEVGANLLRAEGARRYRLGVNAFYNQFAGRVETVDESGTVTPLVNRPGAIRVHGAEADGEVSFGEGDRLRAAMAWFRAVDTQAPPDRRFLTDVPQLRFILETEVGLGDVVDLHLRALFGSERRNNARSTLEALRRFRIPAYALLHATVLTRPLFQRVRLALTVENLLDATYRDDVPRPDRVTDLLPHPGLSARLTLRGEW